MQPVTLVSVADYLRTGYDPDMDFVDGFLEERNVGEFDHSLLQTELAVWIAANARHLGIHAIVELRTRITARRYRVPDVVLLQGKRPRTRVLEETPLAILEILSPEDRMARIRARMDDYLMIGTPYVWLIDPAARRAWRYTREAAQEITGGTLQIDAPALGIRLTDIFATLDQMAE